MKYTSVYAKGSRPHWYVAYFDPKAQRRRYVASVFRLDDPQGKRKAFEWAREKSVAAQLDRREENSGRWELWVENYIDLKHRKSKRTREGEKLRWKWMSLYLEEKGAFVPRAVDYNLVIGYIPWRIALKKRTGRQVTFNTALSELKILGRLMKEAVHRGFTMTNPVTGLGLKRDDPKQKPELKDSEIALIRAELDRLEGSLPLPERWMTISFEIALHQGCRLRETDLPMDRIDFAKDTIQFLAKGRRVFTTQLHPELKPLLVKLRDAGAKRTCELPVQVSRDWSRFFRGRSEHRKVGFMPHVCFHCTRVTVVTRLARAGVPIQQAMAYVHHANELVHRIYTRLKPEDASKCLQALNFSGAHAGPQK
jgi:hypothetical protein